jgi:hypothetical protein
MTTQAAQADFIDGRRRGGSYPQMTQMAQISPGVVLE